MSFIRFAPIVIGAAMLPAAAIAQTSSAAPPADAASATNAAAGVTVGATVYDPQGSEVGTVESVSGGNVVVNTGTNRATLAATSFGKGAKGPTVSATKAQLDAAVADASAKAKTAVRAALVPDAEVRGKDGAVVGKVKAVNGDNVVLDRAAGPVTVPSQYFTTSQNGLALTISAAELDNAAAVASANPGTAPATEGADKQ